MTDRAWALLLIGAGKTCLRVTAIDRRCRRLGCCLLHKVDEAGASVRARVCYDLGSTTLVTTQRCLPILRSRTNPSFS
jgi:hypothetical protein